MTISLIGGRGDDRLIGGGGNDTYVLASDGSRDTIYDGGAGLAGAIRENTVVFPVGVALSDLTLAWHVRQYAPLSIWGHYYFLQSRHAVLEASWGYGVGDGGAGGGAVDIVIPHAETSAGLGIDFFRFADGTEIPFDDILRMLPPQVLDPSAADETTVGGDGDEQFAGNTGDDILEGGGGDDLLVGGAGQDLLVGGPGRIICTAETTSTAPWAMDTAGSARCGMVATYSAVDEGTTASTLGVAPTSSK